MTESTAMPARFVDGESMRLVGTMKRYTFETMGDIPAQWMQFPVPDGKVAYGVIIETPLGEGFDYMVAVDSNDMEEVPTNFISKEIPAQKYAVFLHEGHVSTLCQTFETIFSEWLPASGLEMTHNPDSFERYGEQFDPETGTGDLEIWVPVKG